MRPESQNAIPQYAEYSIKKPCLHPQPLYSSQPLNERSRLSLRLRSGQHTTAILYYIGGSGSYFVSQIVLKSGLLKDDFRLSSAQLAAVALAGNFKCNIESAVALPKTQMRSSMFSFCLHLLHPHLFWLVMQ